MQKIIRFFASQLSSYLRPPQLSSRPFYNLYSSLHPPTTSPTAPIVAFVEHLISTDPYYTLSLDVFRAIVTLASEGASVEVFKVCVEGDTRLRDIKGR
jgi:hypothetical protein